MLHAIILAGGKGERFWPLSRSNKPKQLVKLFSDKTMLEETMDRVESIIPRERQLLVASTDMMQVIRTHIPDLPESCFLLEPQGRNTAPAIALAAVHLLRDDPDAIMVVLPCDHLIRDPEMLRQTLITAADIAEKTHQLCLIGINPDRPETGYGYIEIGDKFERDGAIPAFKVAEFHEKPDRQVAERFIMGQRHLWNSGMFIWRAADILDAIHRCMPEMHSAVMDYARQIGQPTEWSARQAFFSNVKSISIDKGVLEKESNVVVVLKGRFLWDDVGSWGALDRIYDCDGLHNVTFGAAALSQCYDCTVVNEEEGPIVAFGVSDLVVVRANGVVLVTSKTRIPDMRELMDWVRKQKDLEDYL